METSGSFSLLLEFGADARLDESSGGNSTLCAAVRGGNLNIVNHLLDSKFPPDVNHSGPQCTPLSLSLDLGHMEISQKLLASGADVNLQCSDGHTPLLMATWGNQVEMVKDLLQRQADPRGSDKIQCSPLHIAACSGYLDICHLLLQRETWHPGIATRPH